MRCLMTVILLLVTFFAYAQKESQHVNKGNKYYENEKYVESEVEYRKGLEKNRDSFSGNFNLGNTLFRQEKFEDAAKQFEQAAAYADGDKERVAASYHNLGNSLLSAGQIEPSIEAYKQALRNNPTDHETRYNLAYAKKMLQQQEEQQQQQQDNQEQNQDQKDQEQQQDQQQQQENQEQEQQQQEQQQQQSNNEMTKENAEQILEALQQDEKETQDKVKEQQAKQGKRYKVAKDW
ncbi:MAG: tetratricopeptide repeat protein [bacterium]